MYIADLHIHSHYSRATSKDCTPEYLDLWARRKGIGIVGTGDFTHPAWREELCEKLAPAEDGLYILKDEYRIKDPMATDAVKPRFVATGEISSIYKKYGKVRKVHSLILLPGLEEAEMISRKLEAIGNIHSDGRPILGLDCHDLLEIVLELCPEAVYVPAHIWTPHFSLFGAFSGFDSVEECYGDLSPYIHAMETGLSSDPPMNWRVSALDGYQLISNSDAHSPTKLGREANLLDISLSYDGLKDAVQTGRGLKGTIEFFPEEGKYHFDGHRKCGICLSPAETERYGGICPVCGKKLTIGVSHRVEQMADRPEGYVRESGAGYESLVPLPEIIGASVGHSAASAKVVREYERMLRKLGPEFSILREIPLDEIRSASGILISEGIGRLRKGEVTRLPGFDGEYGVIRLFTQRELDRLDGQMSLFETWQEVAEERAMGLDAGSGQMAEEPGEKEQKRQETEPVMNANQRQAIESIDRVTMVTAGPGTGKTGTLVSHILHLLEVRRVRPSCITAVTFTNQAAGEMRERIRKELGRGTAAGKLQIGTFHSIALKYLRKHGMEFTLAGDMETRELAAKVIKEYGLGMTASRFLTEVSKQKTRACLATAEDPDSASTEKATEKPKPASTEKATEKPKPASTEKATEKPKPASTEKATERPEPVSSVKAIEEPDSALSQAATAYQNGLKEWNALDFDDLLLEALRIAREEAAENRKQADAGSFSYLMVDEFQDISPLQYRLMEAWNAGGKELFVIGDADQAIYGFRGADADCFRRLQSEFPEARQVTLEENYRSSPQILALALEVISGNPGGIGSLNPNNPDGIRKLNPNRPDGAPVRLVEAGSEKAEAVFVAKEINRLTGGIGMLEAQELFPETEGQACSFDDIAVLYRTHRQAEALEACLKKEGIPYVVAGREDFLQEPAVRGTVSFFRSLTQPDNHLAGQTALKLLWNLEAGDLTESIYDNMAEKYRAYLKKKPQKILDEWMADLKLDGHKAMQKLYRTAVFYQTMPEFTEALELGVESDLKRCGDKHYQSGAVTLMTLHGSKGLEFPVVIIYGARNGTIPFENENHSSDEEEERRLFYVGITRAREKLLLTGSREESPFLKGISGELLEREQAHHGKNEGNGRQMSLFEFVKNI